MTAEFLASISFSVQITLARCAARRESSNRLAEEEGGAREGRMVNSAELAGGWAIFCLAVPPSVPLRTIETTRQTFLPVFEK